MAIHTSQPPHVTSLLDQVEPPPLPVNLLAKREGDAYHEADAHEQTNIGGDGESSRSALVRFFDSFLSEQNIKWVLGIGALIVVASSLMLVTAHWSQYTPVWKYLIMFGYTATVAVAGKWSYHRLGLVKTGTMLMSMTLLLLPVLFLALHWVHSSAVTASSVAAGADALMRDGPGMIGILMLSATVGFALLTAPPIFRHFLRGNQPTFVASYLFLCLAGALIPIVPDVAMPVVGLMCWAVFAAGAVKVNRHVFWLVEEHRSPRIIGFLPILLLGIQFLMLFTLYVAPHMTLPWVGLGCVLVALPLLMTADAVAHVFQMRTGGLVRPLPLPIISPFVIGLILCLVGLVMAGADVLSGNAAQNPPFALVPTAAIGAAMMCLVARRTGKQAFVWAGLIGATIAYRYAPVYFSEITTQLVRNGAEMIRERRLPIAFYGLTFLPLIVTLMVTNVIANRKGHAFFAKPCRQYSVGLSVLLLAISTLHPKAMMPVALVMIGVFALQTVLYKNHRYAVLGLGSFIMAAIGLPLFLNAVSDITMSAGAILLCVSAAALVLLHPGHRIDQALTRLAIRIRPQIQSPQTVHPFNVLAEAVENPTPAFTPIAYCKNASTLLTALLPAVWLFTLSGLSTTLPSPVFDLMWCLPTAAVISLLVVHTLRTTNVALAWVTMCFGHIAVISGAVALGCEFSTILSIGVGLLAAQWVAGYALRSRPAMRLSTAFAQPNELLMHLGSVALLVFNVVPSILGKVTLVPGMVSLSPWLLCQILVIAMVFDSARRRLNKVLIGLAYLSAIGLACAVVVMTFGSAAWLWLPVLFASVSGLTRTIVAVQRRAEVVSPNRLVIIQAFNAVATSIVYLTAFASLAIFSSPMRIAGGIGIASLLLTANKHSQDKLSLRAALMLANWHGLVLLVTLVSGGSIDSVLELTQLAGSAALPIAFAAAVSLCFWQRGVVTNNDKLSDALSAHRLMLKLFAAVAVVSSAPFDPTMTAVDFIFAGGAMLALIVAELLAAVRLQNEKNVWHALGLVPLAIAYFAWHGLIGFKTGLSMYYLLAGGIALGAIGRLVERRPSLRVLARPFRQTATVLPMATVLMGVGRHFLVESPAWLGSNSLALLLAGGFYFWMGIERKDRRYTFGAAAILNLALALLWNELQFTDPQFYLIPVGITILGIVRLLRDELPTHLREPLNYVGALVILVSPVFHIVDGSWVHLFCLMALSVTVVLTAIGLRVRPMIYTGAAFLVADLIAMIVYGSIADASVLWIAGIALGAAVVVLGALAERNREQLLARLRRVSAAIETWE